ncbi:hypothetical protein L249_7408 [Ophiocordyceps polyrhachis-furcata BCC 54312]|uniref:Uncharacterized protein n=1 Tax=Ophiocordyceps polyrhachis-furcata BCC 54312 TaxID=1330021 RepID=A0A367LB37_9HYPO|nr:hypothetical protein L249_7408 [Ophiocordyceps polyrhachis-furcata BCC 54312]
MCMIWVSGPSSSFIAARELGKSDFLMESNKVFCGAVKEEEGGEKLVEMEIIMSNQGVDHVIEKKKTNHVIVVFLEEDFNIMDQPDDLTLYSAPIDVTAALCRDQSGAMTAIGTARRSLPTVTQGVVAGLRPNCLLTRTKDNSLSYKDFYGYIKDLVYC